MRPRPDVARLLGATGPGAWALAALYGLVYVVISFWVDAGYTGTPLGLAALAAMIGAAALLVLPQLSPFPHVAAAAVTAAAVFANVAGLAQLDTTNWHGWVTWYIGASTYLAFTLALRGRFVWGLTLVLAVTAVAIIWAGLRSGNPLDGLSLTWQQLVLFGAGSFFSLWLRRAASRIAAFQDARVRLTATETSREAADEERAEELRIVRGLAGSALEQIAAGASDAALRREHRILEAELRDRIRGRALAADPLAGAVRGARERGAAVALLDDLRADAPDLEELATALTWAARRVERAGDHDVTVRLSRRREGVILSVATELGESEELTLSVPAPPAAPDPPG